MSEQEQPEQEKPRAKDKRRAAVVLKTKFQVHFLDEMHKQSKVYRILNERYERIKQHAKVESEMQDLIVRRTVFMSILMESMEVEATKTGELNITHYSQLINNMVGALRLIGLDRKDVKDIIGNWQDKWAPAQVEEEQS